MSWLLHSKLFRKNLCKWVIMYVCVMCLVTTVITYSKYITQLQNDGDARQAVFKVDIAKFVPENAEYHCDLEDLTKCEVQGYRPTKDIDFYFKVDYSMMEAAAEVFVNVILDQNLEIKKAYSVDVNGENEYSVNCSADNKESGSSTYKCLIKFDVVPTEDPDIKKTQVKYYKIVASHKKNEDGIYNLDNEEQNIYIGYSAYQVKNSNTKK